MESHFFVEAKSFAFSVVKGKSKLQLEERKSFSRVVFLGPRCIAWLVATVEEVLRNPRVEEFVKSTRMLSPFGGAVTRPNVSWRWQITLRWPKRFFLLPEGHEGRGWSRFSGELRKVMAFFEAMNGFPSSVDSSPVGKKNGKNHGPRLGVILESPVVEMMRWAVGRLRLLMEVMLDVSPVDGLV
jgi:hypothetical protein